MMKRDRYCARISEADIGEEICFMGWVQNIRDMGGIIFLDLRDKTGIVQVVCDLNNFDSETFKLVETIRNEYVIAAKGLIRARDQETFNPKLPTGTIELKALEVEILSKSKPLPFQIEDNSSVKEDLRLKHRYLDIRKPSLYNNLVLRHSTLKVIRRFLEDREFLEVETPILTKSTPEGARDYLVPSRIHKGEFYALPQSPQIFKQLLMTSGIDKYYQIAKCFRDEDLRSDRQPEFTQVDMELSFVSQEEILSYLEIMFKEIMRDVLDLDIKEDFRRITYKDAMELYGTDKPDIRFEMKMVDLSDTLEATDFKVFKEVLGTGGKVKAINIKGGNSFTRTEIDELTNKAIDYGAKGMAWIAQEENGELRSILTKYFSKDVMDELLDKMDSKPGDLIVFSADTIDIVNKSLGGLRLYIADKLGLRRQDDFKFLIVTDFPLLEWSSEGKRFVSKHHPFTMMNEEDIDLLESNPEEVRAKSYDVVLNGVELGSGSVRIHDSEIQKKMFEVLGLSQEDIESRFGFILDAFSYGTPPHGGFAFGLDRLVMMMAGEDSIREVIAFPKTREGVCPLSGAPSPVDPDQLRALDLGYSIENINIQKDKIKKDIGIENLAKNSYFFLEDKKQEYEDYINEMIKFSSPIEEVDVSNYKPTININPIENSFRADTIEKEFTRDELFKDINSSIDGYILLEKGRE